MLDVERSTSNVQLPTSKEIKKRAGPSRTALSCVVRDPGLWRHEFTLLCCRGSLSHERREGVPDLPRITAATTPARSAALHWLARARTYLPAPESALL